MAVVDDSAGDRRSVTISPPHALLAQVTLTLAPTPTLAPTLRSTLALTTLKPYP